MDALLEDDDDGWPVVAEKLANITNKAFSKQHAIESVKKKKEVHKNCDKVMVPRVNKEIWRQMIKQGFIKKKTRFAPNEHSELRSQRVHAPY